MPSPIGHLLAGGAVALLGHSPRVPGGLEPRLAATIAACAALAALPDLDLVLQPFYPVHRTVTHSLVSIPVVTIVAMLVTGWVTDLRSLRLAVLCGLAWGSHIPLDWLGADPNPPSGIQILWPFSDHWFISGLDLFPGTERREIFTRASVLTNAHAVLREATLLGPPVVVLVVLRRRRWRRAERSP